jgi:hypothetical protein
MKTNMKKSTKWGKERDFATEVRTVGKKDRHLERKRGKNIKKKRKRKKGLERRQSRQKSKKVKGKRRRT